MAVTTRARSVSHRGTLRSSSRSGPRSSSFASNVDFRICVAVLILVTIASKCGDALAPTLADLKPLLLLALNANDLHLALTAGRTLVSSLSNPTAAPDRTSEAKKHFTCPRSTGAPILCRRRRAEAVGGSGVLSTWVEIWGTRCELAGRPHAGHGGRFQEGQSTGSGGFATLAVALEARRSLCLLAGTSRMSPGWFATVNVIGTVIRVAAIRFVGRVAVGRVNAVLRPCRVPDSSNSCDCSPVSRHRSAARVRYGPMDTGKVYRCSAGRGSPPLKCTSLARNVTTCILVPHASRTLSGPLSFLSFTMINPVSFSPPPCSSPSNSDIFLVKLSLVASSKPLSCTG